MNNEKEFILHNIKYLDHASRVTILKKIITSEKLDHLISTDIKQNNIGPITSHVDGSRVNLDELTNDTIKEVYNYMYTQIDKINKL
jgi:hypothetical protein